MFEKCSEKNPWGYHMAHHHQRSCGSLLTTHPDLPNQVCLKHLIHFGVSTWSITNNFGNELMNCLVGLFMLWWTDRNLFVDLGWHSLWWLREFFVVLVNGRGTIQPPLHTRHSNGNRGRWTMKSPPPPTASTAQPT